MSKLKKWQCPHCPQDSTRHWNVVVHIRRKHGFGDPAEKRDSDQADAFYFHADKTNKNREHSQDHHDNNRYTIGYKTGRGNNDFGDIVDYVYRFLTEIEEMRYKMGEINRIADKHNSSMTPKWIPSMNYDRQAFPNAIHAWLSNLTKNNRSAEQGHSNANAAATSNQEIKKTSHDLFPSDEEDNTQQLSSSVHPASSGDQGWIKKEGWKVKYDMYGNVLDAYKCYEDI
jgi:hypothetical protein